MLKEERQDYILNRLNQDSKVLLEVLSKELKVSEDTVRRDIKELDGKGLVKAVRGGALIHSKIPHAYQERVAYNNESKKTIAQKVLPLLKDGQLVIFDGGTSTMTLAALLPKELQLTVVTNSFPVASALQQHPSVEVLMTGGRLLKNAFITTGFDTLKFLGNIKADLCVLGICSIHQTNGITTFYYEESEVKRAMIAASQKVVALSTVDKLETVEPFFVADSNALDTIVTDAPPDDPRLSTYFSKGIKIL